VRHSGLVRVAHGITALSFLALLFSGIEILISHPCFYWGENGNVLTPALFQLPIPSSRSFQNGWSRSLHFQSAWLLVLAGLVYLIAGFLSGHFRQDMLHRLSYLVVIFVLFPVMVWTGLAMSPAASTKPRRAHDRSLATQNDQDPARRCRRHRGRGCGRRPGAFSLAQLKCYPSRSQITQLACEEGWPCVAEWTGVPLSHVLEAAGIRPRAKFVAYFSIEHD
jgi:hypothetical protein